MRILFNREKIDMAFSKNTITGGYLPDAAKFHTYQSLPTEAYNLICILYSHKDT